MSETTVRPIDAIEIGGLDLHQADPVDGPSLRRVCGMFVTGVTVITAEGAGEAVGTTVNSFTSVSLDPPLVLFCLHRNSRLAPIVREGAAFVVNFLAGRQEQVAWAFAGSRTAVLGDVGYRRSSTGPPVLSDALSFLVCRVVDEFDGGDHVIWLGQVVELGVPRRHREPLVFFGGAMGTLEQESPSTHPAWEG
jgi:3-hydroxy-9,10-secoandrosta-1,3,5(10)-triene-9,17-dione monooxygenase reductase component